MDLKHAQINAYYLTEQWQTNLLEISEIINTYLYLLIKLFLKIPKNLFGSLSQKLKIKQKKNFPTLIKPGTISERRRIPHVHSARGRGVDERGKFLACISHLMHVGT